MTVRTDYLVETESRIKEWALYYHTSVRGNRQNHTGIVSGSREAKVVDVTPGDIPADVQEIEQIINNMPAKLNQVILSAYYYHDSKFDGACRLSITEPVYTMQLSRAMHWIAGVLSVIGEGL